MVLESQIVQAPASLPRVLLNRYTPPSNPKMYRNMNTPKTSSLLVARIIPKVVPLQRPATKGNVFGDEMGSKVTYCCKKISNNCSVCMHTLLPILGSITSCAETFSETFSLKSTKGFSLSCINELICLEPIFSYLILNKSSLTYYFDHQQ